MTIRAAAEQTVSDYTDADHILTWHHDLQASVTPPAAPTTTQASAVPAGWSTAEPTISTDADLGKYAFSCQQVVWGDGTCSWGEVTLSASFEAAKRAYNQALAASQVATNYVTDVSSDGIWVTPSNGKPTNGAATSSTTGWHISDVLEYFRQGVSWFKLWLDSTAMKLRLGQEASGHLVMDDDGLEIFEASANVASFGSEEARIGQSEAAHLTMSSFGMTATNEDLATYYQLLLDGATKVVRYNDGIVHPAKTVETTNLLWLQTSASMFTQVTPEGTTYTWEANACGVEIRLPSPWGWVLGSGTVPTGDVRTVFVDENSEGRYNLLYVSFKNELVMTKSGSTQMEAFDFTVSASSDGGSTEHPMYIMIRRRINYGSTPDPSSDRLLFFANIHPTESGLTIPITAHISGNWPVYTLTSKSPALSFGTSDAAPGAFSASLGQGLKASGDYQVVVGRYNKEDVNGEYAFIVGGGTADDARVNPLSIRKDGGLVESVLALDVTDTSSSNYYRAIEANDKNGQNIGNLVAGREPNSNMFYIEAMNGTTQNAVWLHANDDGTASVTLSHRDAWFDALGLKTLARKSTVALEYKTVESTSAKNSSAVASGGNVNFTCNCTVPSGYIFAGIQRVGRTGGAGLVLLGYDASDTGNTATLSFRNMASSSIAANTASATCEFRFIKATVS